MSSLALPIPSASFLKNPNPATALDISVFCKGDADKATALELLQDVVKPVVELYLKNPKTPKYKMEKVGDDSLCLYWPEDAAIGEFT